MGVTSVCNGADQREAEDIKTRWQGNTEELHNKDINNPDYHYGIIIHLEPFWNVKSSEL